MPETFAFISVGSNIGDKRAQCESGIRKITHPRISQLIERSPCYRTEPVGYVEQDWFINAVIKISTRLDPYELLDQLKQIERDAGRTDTGTRFGPRCLDLDILLYGDDIVETDRLVVPHPRMHKRRFVLLPFCDIDPHIVHPVLGKTIHSLLADLPMDEQIVLEDK